MKCLIFLLLFSCSDKKNNKSEVFKGTSDSSSISAKKSIDSSHNIEDFKNNISNTEGVVVLKFDQIAKLKILNENGSVWQSINLTKSTLSISDSIKPFSISLDYFLLVFKCTKKEKDRYEILVNEEKSLKKYIRKSPGVVLQSWEKHITEVYAIEFDPKTNPLRVRPELRSDIVTKDNDEFYFPVKVVGDWLQVKWGEENNWNFAWIRWRQGGKLLVELFYYA